MQIDILAIGVHPDDVELACSGTLLHHIAIVFYVFVGRIAYTYWNTDLTD